MRPPFLLWLFSGNPKSALVCSQGGIYLDRQSSCRRHLVPLGKCLLLLEKVEMALSSPLPHDWLQFSRGTKLTEWVYLTREIYHIDLHLLGKCCSGCLHAVENETSGYRPQQFPWSMKGGSLLESCALHWILEGWRSCVLMSEKDGGGGSCGGGSSSRVEALTSGKWR